MTTIPGFLPIDPAVGRPGIKIMPQSITIHWIGPYPSQNCSIVRDWWVSNRGYAAAHYIVHDGAVMRCIPDNEMAYHAGCLKGNRTSIGIEVIPQDKNGSFSDESIATLKHLIADIRTRYGDLPLLRHYDWTNKACPAYYIPYSRWKMLKDTLNDYSSI